MTKGIRLTPSHDDEHQAPGFSDIEGRVFSLLISHWFLLHRRTLPWRNQRSAYRVWLSEIMLQQTQVATVIPYFERFTSRFATVTDLADAPLDEVLALWSGLGYYARGRNLHKAAKRVRDEFAGAFPKTVPELESLPGVGKYTARAIATFAFGARVPVVDGNIARVFSRIFDDATPINTPAGQRGLWAHAQRLVEHAEEPPVYNEGLIEFGALLCTPKSPRCHACPVAALCRGQLRAHSLPRKKAKAKKKESQLLALVPFYGESVYLERRAERGLFGGLYETPTETLALRSDEQCLKMLRERNLKVAKIHAPLPVSRTLTHRRLHFSVIPVALAEDPGTLFEREDLDGIGISSSVRAILNAAWPP